MPCSSSMHCECTVNALWTTGFLHQFQTVFFILPLIGYSESISLTWMIGPLSCSGLLCHSILPKNVENIHIEMHQNLSPYSKSQSFKIFVVKTKSALNTAKLLMSTRFHTYALRMDAYGCFWIGMISYDIFKTYMCIKYKYLTLFNSNHVWYKSEVPNLGVRHVSTSWNLYNMKHPRVCIK